VPVAAALIAARSRTSGLRERPTGRPMKMVEPATAIEQHLDAERLAQAVDVVGALARDLLVGVARAHPARGDAEDRLELIGR